METSNEKLVTDDLRRVAEYLLPRMAELIADGWLTAPPELQQEQAGRVVEPLLDLASMHTMSVAFRYVYTSLMVYATKGNLSHAARILGVDRSTLVRTLRRMGKEGIDFSPERIKALMVGEPHV